MIILYDMSGSVVALDPKEYEKRNKEIKELIIKEERAKIINNNYQELIKELEDQSKSNIKEISKKPKI